jgi:hypothetical protein
MEPAGSPLPSIDSGYLKFTNVNGQQVDYDADLNADSQQVGAIRVKCTPKYSGVPATIQAIFDIAQADGVADNIISLVHQNVTGNLRLIRTSKDGTDYSYDLGVWLPTLDSEYIIEYNWDLSGPTGDGCRLFIDGNQFGATNTQAYTRDSSIGLLRFGGSTVGTLQPNFWIRDIIVFNSVQHTANHSPGYTVGDTNPVIDGKVQQKDQRPDGAVLGITYTVNEDINWGQGVGTGALFNGASVSSEWLVLPSALESYAQYTGLSLPADNAAVKFVFRPSFNGPPTADRYLFSSHTGGQEISLAIRNTGQLLFVVRNDAGGQAIALTTNAVAWIVGQEYEILVNWNVAANIGNVYVKGTKEGDETVFTGVRTVGNTVLNVGNYSNPIFGAFGDIKDFVVFDSVQETGASYATGYTLSDSIYAETKVSLPQFLYTGLGAVQAFTEFDITEEYIPKTINNGLYHPVDAWVVSDGTRAQSSPSSVVSANIDTLPASDTLDIDIWFQASNNQANVSSLTVTYTGQEYDKNTPSIQPTLFLPVTKITGISEDAIKPAGTEIKYVVAADGTWYWVNGGVLEETDGSTPEESSTKIEWDAIWPGWEPSESVNIEFKAWFFSDSGDKRAELKENIISYIFAGPDPEDVEKCRVYGVVTDQGDDSDPRPVKVRLTENVVKYKNTVQVTKVEKTVYPNPVDKKWNIALVENENMSPLIGSAKPQYIFTIDGEELKRTVPNKVSEDFLNLEE